MAQNTTQKEIFIFMDFYKLLKELTKASELNLSDICVMSVLVTYAQYADNKTVEMSANNIKKEFERLNIRTIKKSLQHLTELNYIETIKQPAPKPNKYKILIELGQAQNERPIKHTKKNIIETDADYLSEVNEAVNANRFLLNKGDK